MRRISYTFPHSCDIEFEVPVTFAKYLDAVEKLAGRQDNFRTEIGPVKRDISVHLAVDRTGFEKITRGSNISRIVTDEADIIITFSDTILKSDGHLPMPDKKYLVKALDKGTRTEIFVTGENSAEFKRIIYEACTK
ncbi:MAG: hypothetical protein Q4Q53_03500 [Methanocorpusculum sp.]|nr:hypothetical protein [Methanocorpusculum sp.]